MQKEELVVADALAHFATIWDCLEAGHCRESQLQPDRANCSPTEH